MSIVLVGSTSGSVTLQEPAVAGTTVLTLPAVSGTVLTTGTTGQVIASGALPIGSVLQVVSGSTGAGASTSSGTYVASGFSVSITPKFATSKIYVVVTSQITNTSNGGADVNVTVFRNGSVNLQTGDGLTYYQNNGSNTYVWVPAAMSALDSPATTSATTYATYFKRGVSGIGYLTNSTMTMTLMEIAA